MQCAELTVRWVTACNAAGQSETRALLVSTVCALVMGVIAIFVTLATGSGAILLDGAFNLCFFATALVTLTVAKLLHSRTIGAIHSATYSSSR